MVWVSVGFGGESPAVMRAVLEARRDFLRAELSRAEAMLSEKSSSDAAKEVTGKASTA
jgi:hypothetical protein